MDAGQVLLLTSTYMYQQQFFLITTGLITETIYVTEGRSKHLLTWNSEQGRLASGEVPGLEGSSGVPTCCTTIQVSTVNSLNIQNDIKQIRITVKQQ